MRKSTLFWLFLAAVCGAFLFHTSQKVTDGRARLSALARAIGKEQDSLRVLGAEWSYLNQPDRLEKLSQQYLQLALMKGRQFVRISDLENRPGQPETVSGTAHSSPGKKEPPAVKPPVRIQKPLSEHPLAAATLPKPERPAKPRAEGPQAAQTNAANIRSFGDVMQSLGVR